MVVRFGLLLLSTMFLRSFTSTVRIQRVPASKSLFALPISASLMARTPFSSPQLTILDAYPHRSNGT
jgi:hypothetical protein